MNIVSYRGPNSPGGVSATLARIFDGGNEQQRKWWYINDHCLTTKDKSAEKPERTASLPAEMLEGHYRYCNDFLWPILHGLTQYVHYDKEDRSHYQRFNLATAFHVQNTIEKGVRADCFVNDYQFALMPKLLEQKGIRVTAFWHIPWPVSVPDAYVEPMKEIVENLLGSRVLGFHTAEYARNFMQFVKQYFPQHLVEADRNMVVQNDQPGTRDGNRFNRKLTEVLVKPLGIDVDYWKSAARQAIPEADTLKLAAIAGTSLKDNKPYILSVDRGDYTKGILPRLDAIELFFEKNPDRIGKVYFLQMCQPSRINLKEFTKYWASCQARVQEINDRFRTDDWQPIVWVEKSVGINALSKLYKDAAAMLITPVRDGLNLTAKEFIACGGDDPGVLLLSSGAGAWWELGKYALHVDPRDKSQIVGQIERALEMPRIERLSRSRSMKQTLRANALQVWANGFRSVPETATTPIMVKSDKLEKLPLSKSRASGRNRQALSS